VIHCSNVVKPASTSHSHCNKISGVNSAVSDHKNPKRVCRLVRHRDPERVKPGSDWVSLQMPPNLMETIEAFLAYEKPKVGWCLLCGSPIESEADFIPNTNTHSCPEGLRFHEASPDS
jgi:hypothetical protein